MNAVIPLISSLVSLGFAAAVFHQYLARRKNHQLLWFIGLLMYAVSTFTEFWAGVWGISQAVYRTWYLVGAVLVVAYLGMGTIFLLAPAKTARRVLAVLAVLSVYAAVRVLTAQIDLSGLATLSGSAMPDDIRRMTPLFNTFGTVALVGGAIYSAVVFRRRRILPHRVVSNTLIAVGAILPAIGGTALRFGGSVQVFYLLELAGITIIFIGFLKSREVFGYHVNKSQIASQERPS